MDTRAWEERGLREAVIAGDEAAWRRLYGRCFGPLYAHVYYRCGRDVPRTEDIVQECWLTAVKRIRHFDPARGSFEAWLRGIADNVVRNRRRWWARRDRTELPMADPGRLAAEVPARDTTAPDEVAAVLAALPDTYREVLRAKYAEGRSVAEIAEERVQTPKAVESLLARARKAFREAYVQLQQNEG